MKKIRKNINRMPFGQDMTMIIARVVGKPINAILSAKVFVILSYKLTKFLFSDKGKTSIIILCRRKP